jgi:hypothetical protein
VRSSAETAIAIRCLAIDDTFVDALIEALPHDRPSSAIDTKLTVPTLRLVTRVLGLPLYTGKPSNGKDLA